MYGDLKFPNSAGTDYNSLDFEISADVVTYSNTTLANALDNLSIGKIPHADSVDTAEKAEKDLSGNVISETYLTSANAEMTGTPTAPEYDGTDTTVNQIATCGYFNGLVRKYAGEIDSDMTLAKIIASINQDPNFATNVATQLDNKQDKNSNLTALNNLSSETGLILATSSDTLTTFSTTDKGNKILAASDLERVRGIIQAPTAEFIFDETEKIHWEKVGSPTITTANAKFSKALQVDSANKLYSKEQVTFGGNPFTIDLWANVINNDLNTRKIFFTAGDIQLKIWLVNTGAYSKFIFYGGNDYKTMNTDYTYVSGQTIHLEIGYNSGTVYLFENGKLKNTKTISISRSARTITLGGEATCSISSFRILDGVCLHTSNFSPPSSPYELTDKTVTLFNL